MIQDPLLLAHTNFQEQVAEVGLALHHELELPWAMALNFLQVSSKKVYSILSNDEWASLTRYNVIVTPLDFEADTALSIGGMTNYGLDISLVRQFPCWNKFTVFARHVGLNRNIYLRWYCGDIINWSNSVVYWQ